jgi:hypothetical protein
MATSKKQASRKKASGKKTPKKALTALSLEHVAAIFGVTIQKKLTTKQVQRLRRPLPGYVNMLDDAADKLEADADLIKVKGVSPEALRQAKTDQTFLADREAIAEALHRSIYEQRMIVDDHAVEMLQKIARRIEAESEDNPSLPLRWKALLAYLASFRGGGRPAKSEPETTDE